jgi:uncharacterized protein with HEPN domain
MNRSYRDYVEDMLDNCEYAIEFVQGVTLDEFLRSREKSYAVAHAIEIIGEAARHIPKTLRAKYPEIPWSNVTGMRDHIAHGYFGIDLEIVWKTIHEDLPGLRVELQSMLADLRDDA